MMTNERFLNCESPYKHHRYRIVGQKDISKGGGFEKSIDVPLTSSEYAGVCKFIKALDESTAVYPLHTISSITEE